MLATLRLFRSPTLAAWLAALLLGAGAGAAAAGEAAAARIAAMIMVRCDTSFSPEFVDGGLPLVRR